MIEKYRKKEEVLVVKWDGKNETFNSIKEICCKIQGLTIGMAGNNIGINLPSDKVYYSITIGINDYFVLDFDKRYPINAFNEIQLNELYVPLQPKYNDDGLELRGYGIMPYNIRAIQCGIQYAHSLVEYVLDFFNTQSFQLWGKKYKTSVLLNGGTSNHSVNRYSEEEYLGSMEQHLKQFQDNGITFSTFYEPDMNDMLSGIFLIVDERAFNFRKYPDYGFKYNKVTEKFEKEDWYTNGTIPTQEWLESIGGEKNYFLRQYLSKLPLWR